MSRFANCNDCTSGEPSEKLCRYADDTIVIGLIHIQRREEEQLVL